MNPLLHVGQVGAVVVAISNNQKGSLTLQQQHLLQSTGSHTRDCNKFRPVRKRVNLQPIAEPPSAYWSRLSSKSAQQKSTTTTETKINPTETTTEEVCQQTRVPGHGRTAVCAHSCDGTLSSAENKAGRKWGAAAHRRRVFGRALCVQSRTVHGKKWSLETTRNASKRPKKSLLLSFKTFKRRFLL